MGDAAQDPLIASLSAAVTASPDDLPLRLHLAGLLLEAGHRDEAVAHAATALTKDPGSADAMAVLTRANQPAEQQPVDSTPPPPPPRNDAPDDTRFDWNQAEQDLDDVAQPMFVEGDDAVDGSAFNVEQAAVRLDDVGGMQQVKQRLDAAFLAPLKHPELRKLYGKSLRGGLLLYGPPGCGKTFIAEAVAGELGAAFLSVSLADVLDMYIGNSEKNVKQLFETARQCAPCVLFLDELDAIGQKRSLTRSSGIRTTVNQLLTEMDGIGSHNEGVFVLAATNHPWDVDPALRRPGRLDRTVLVLPPDSAAREAIFRYHLRDRPVEGISLSKLAKRTEGFSGADLQHVCDSAAEAALLESSHTGTVRTMQMRDFDQVLQQIHPSIGAWLDEARNVALFANQSGEYDDLATYLRKHHKG